MQLIRLDKMDKILLYKPDNYPLIKAWYESWDLVCDEPEYLPKIGIIVNNQVAAFLLQTDTPLASISHLISNKNITENRSHSVALGVDWLIKYAHKIGVKKIFIRTIND